MADTEKNPRDLFETTDSNLTSLRNRYPLSPLNKSLENLEKAIIKLPERQKEQIMKAAEDLAINFCSPNTDKNAVIDIFRYRCHEALQTRQYHPFGENAAHAVTAVALTAVAILAAGTIGLAIGFAAGLWAGPGALVTALLGAAGAVSFGGVAATACVYGFFKAPSEAIAVDAVAKVAASSQPLVYI